MEITELRGPADADNFRVKVGRYGDRWYTDPLPACDIAPASDWHGPSVSATKPPFANKYVPMRSIAEMTDDEWRRLAEQSAEDRYEAIKTHDRNTSRVNMRRGTIVHQWAEDLLAGRPMSSPLVEEAAALQAERFRASLESFFDAYQPEPVAVEVPCLHRSLNDVGYGGTADVFAKVKGAVWAIDWKSRTSDHGAYLEEAAQGGAYCGAEYMIVDAGDGTAKRAPLPEVAGVLIVSITADSYKCYPIDRDGAIKAYAEMHRWWVAQNQVRENKVIGRPWAPKTATTKTAASTDGTDARQANEPSVDAVKARVAELVEQGHSDRLRTAWPFRADGTPVPTFKAGDHIDGDMTLINAAVDKVRADIGAEFDTVVEPDPQPRVKPQPVVEASVDEGGKIAQADVNKLREKFASLPDDRTSVIAEIARDANAVGRSISVATSATKRRAAIAEALIAWARSDADQHALETAISLAATRDQTGDADQTLGALLSRFTIVQANSLRDTFGQSAAA